MKTKTFQRVLSILMIVGWGFSSASPIPANSAPPPGEARFSAVERPAYDPAPPAEPRQTTGIPNGKPFVVLPERSDLSPALRQVRMPAPQAVLPPKEIPLGRPPRPESAVHAALPGALLQSQAAPANMPAPLQNFEGVGNADNQAVLGGIVQPPDTQGDVGPNHYVQWNNLVFAVWDKHGNRLLGPLAGNSIWSGFGGACQNTNHGDPITLYDPLADRWLMSQFALPNYPYGPFYQCIAISQTPDPTAAWFRYAYQIPSNKMNDYPKFGVWPDGYYMTVNQFTAGAGGWGGVGAAAFERQQMLLGDPAARMVYFDVGAVNTAYSSMLPADLDGPPFSSPPPAGAPAIFVEWDDSSWISSPNDTLRGWEFSIDWTDPNRATFGADASFAPNFSVATADVDPNLCSYARSCIPQPGTTNRLDAISDRLMYRLQYRNFGNYQALVSNHTVDVNGADQAGIHWFELRDTGGGWSMYQEGVYAPDSHHRWMGSAALDHHGNLALGFSAASSSLHPSVHYAGRLASDPPGNLAQGEAALVAGSGSQTSWSNRWGDYSMLGVDPADDCTFWYTQEYYGADGPNWQTRIGAFKFPSCSVGPTGILSGTVTEQGSAAPVENAAIQAGPSVTQTYTTRSAADGSYALYLPVGTVTATVSAYGYYPASAAGIAITQDATTRQDFTLTPAPRAVISGTVKDALTGWPLYAKIAIAGYPGDPIFSDPETGFYAITLVQGIAYTFTAQAFVAGYLPQAAGSGMVAGDQTLDLLLDADLNACEAPGYRLSNAGGIDQDFESWPPAGWKVTSNVASGLVWKLDSAYGDGNYTGGSGHAATVDSDHNLGTPYDTELRSPPFDLSGILTQTLQYRLNFQSYSGLEALDVELSADHGATWNNLRHFTTDQGAIYALPGVQDSIDLSAWGAASQVYLRWRYYTRRAIPWDWYAQVDEVRLGGAALLDCAPRSGGLVVGNVYDANTLAPLTGATVASDGDASTATLDTPEDPSVGNSFYTLFASPGPHTFLASLRSPYGQDMREVMITQGKAARQDFYLPAGKLRSAPSGLQATVPMGQNTSQALTLYNDGGLPVHFELMEINKGMVISGPFEQPVFGIKPFRQHQPDTQGLKVPASAPGPSFDAGQVIQSWPTGLSYAWGLAYDAGNGTVWVSSPSPGWSGSDALYEYTTSGIQTGRSYPHAFAHTYGPADMAYNWRSGKLWILELQGNCIYEIDPASGYTGASICFKASISQRGLAYDPSTDTWFAGGWNDYMIYRFAPDGTLLAQVNVGIPIAGLAYNPDTEHLFVVENQSPNKFYVLDVADNYSQVGQFTAAGFGEYSGAGLEFDCDGNLWAVNQQSNSVYQIESGETTSVCAADLPWLSTAPVTGTLGAHTSLPVNVTFDAAAPGVEQPGNYSAQLKIRNDTPYLVANVPLSMTVSAPPSWGRLHGTVTGLGYCDQNPAPGKQAQVTLQSATGQAWQLQADTAGQYTYWVEASGSPYTVTAALPGHLAGSASGVAVDAQQTTTQDFALRWLKPCASAAPAGLDAQVLRGLSVTLPVTLYNSGAAATSFEVFEGPGAQALPITLPGSSGFPAMQSAITTPEDVRPASKGGSPAGFNAPAAWGTGAALPGSGRYRAGSGCDVTCARVWSFGGGGGMADVLVYDARSDAWTTGLAPIPHPAQNWTAVYIDDKFYLPGGYNGAHNNWLQIYNVATNTWSAGANLPAARTPMAAAYGGKLFIFGGNPGPSAETWMYDPASDTWAEKTAMPTARTYGRAIAVGKHIYVLGGSDSSSTNGAFERYTPQTDTWTSGPAMQPRGDISLFAVGNDLYAVGGINDYWTWYGLTTVQRYHLPDFPQGSWESLPAAPQAFAAASYGCALGKMWSIGGVNNTGFETTDTRFQDEGLPCADCLSADIPWLAAAPITGTIQAGGSAVVDVTLSALYNMIANMPYPAVLRIKTEDPFNSLLTIPLSVTAKSLYPDLYFPLVRRSP